MRARRDRVRSGLSWPPTPAFYANVERQNPFPIVVDIAAMMESWKKLARLAGDERRIVPGHYPRVMKRYPHLDVAGLEAVMLHKNRLIALLVRRVGNCTGSSI